MLARLVGKRKVLGSNDVGWEGTTVEASTMWLQDGAYHAWAPGEVGSVAPGRSLWIDRLEWRDGKPHVQGPTCAPQTVL
ncbi:MAG: hypothetical protein MSC30_15685 [Gaiellaceae bacterium MAG52_C11]|nr:hypothetical protein [Candidatus Gaiellasilicea maunaloa]